MGFPGDAMLKNLHANVGDARDVGSIPGLGRSPGRGNGNPLQSGKVHGQRSLESYRPWSCNEQDMPECLSVLIHTFLDFKINLIDSSFGKIHWRRDTAVFLGFYCGSAGKESACNAGDLGSIPGLGRYPAEGTHFSILAWRIPWTVQSMGSQKVRHD